MNTIRCPRCCMEKDESYFSIARGRKNGRQLYCKECYKIINSETYKRSPERRTRIKQSRDNHREEIQRTIIEYLSGKKCERCGFDNILALEFHHRDRGLKAFNVSTSVRTQYSIKKIVEEINKCEVLCSNCHRILEAEINNSFKFRNK